MLQWDTDGGGVCLFQGGKYLCCNGTQMVEECAYFRAKISMLQWDTDGRGVCLFQGENIYAAMEHRW